jgi:membrane protein
VIWFLIRVLRIILLTFRGFIENKCQLRASSLTFYSLLSIVPVMAMAFGVAKGFGFQRTLEKEIGRVLSAHSEIAGQIMSFANSLLENTKGGLVAGVGFAFLVWTVLKVLSNIEQSFNEIWGVQEPRTWVRKVSVLLPVLFIVSSAATVIVAGQIQAVMGKVSLVGYLAPVIQVLIRLLPLLVIWFMFTLLYIFMPNTHVRIRAALIAGIAAGTAYQVFQRQFCSTSPVPYLAPGKLDDRPVGCRAVLCHTERGHLRVRAGRQPRKPRIQEIVGSEDRQPPGETFHDLSEAGIITSVRLPQERIFAYQPAFDPDAMTIAAVLDSLENTGTDNLPVLGSPELDQIRRSMEIFSEENRRSRANLPLKEIGEEKESV